MTSGAETVVTGDDGWFELHQAGSTYDVAIRDQWDAALYVGLSRRDPVLPAPEGVAPRWQDVDGHVVGLPSPLPPNVSGSVSMLSADAYGGSPIDTHGVFAFTAPLWSGVQRASGTLRALLRAPAEGGALLDFYYGAVPVVTGGDAGTGTTSVAIPVASIGSRTVTITANTRPSMTSAEFAITAQFPFEPPWSTSSGAMTGDLTTSVQVPKIEGATTAITVSELLAIGGDPARHGRSARTTSPGATATAIDFALEAPVTVLTPVPLTRGPLASTEFTWTASDMTFSRIAQAAT